MNSNLIPYMPVDQIKVGITNGVYLEARGVNARIIIAVISIAIIATCISHSSRTN